MTGSNNGSGIRIGVFVCHCGTNISKVVDVARVAESAQKLPGVVISKHYRFMCSDPGQEMIQADIKENKLNRIVVAACSPLMHENTFREAVEEGGINRYFFEMANIREQVSWVTIDPEMATEKATAIVRAAVARVSFHEPLEMRRVPIRKKAAVIGAGIAGIESALQMADAGFEVDVIEREPSIGGHMSRFDKTFPTLDCAACILTPKMVALSKHPNINLHTYTEVESVEGYVGNFKLKIKKKARYVDTEICNSCGLCYEYCPSHPSPVERQLSVAEKVFVEGKHFVPELWRRNETTFEEVLEDKKQGREKLAPCTEACPQGTPIRRIMAAVGRAREYGRTQEEAFDEAWRILTDWNPLPAVCGRVCPHPCEDHCNRSDKDEALGINSIERFIGDWGIDRKLSLSKSTDTGNGGKIAVVGSGPAGLNCACHLARRGYKVTMYEAFPHPGGMLRYGIPAYRLPREVLDAEIERILDLGVDLCTNTSVGKDVSIEDLRREYDTVFIGIGAHRGVKLGVPGEEAPNVYSGVTFLREINGGKGLTLGNKVVVIGGGDTAIDAARVARRMGASEVAILYRRTREEMPAIEEEIVGAEEEGIRFYFLGAPIKFILEEGNAVAVQCQRMKLGEPDESGRRRPVPVPGDEFRLEASCIISAVSQEPSAEGFEQVADDGGWIKADEQGVTRESKVFAGGDVLGLGLVTHALAHGRKAAETIHAQLSGHTVDQPGQHPVITADEMDMAVFEPAPRLESIQLSVEERFVDPWQEIRKTFDTEMAINEARRCMGCGSCLDCHLCERVCSNLVGVKALTVTSQTENGVTVPIHRITEDCILCGACAHICPKGIMQIRDRYGRQVDHAHLNLGPNSAISLPFRQAVPNVPYINTEKCIHFKTDNCGTCQTVCPKECIDYNDTEEYREIEAGTIVMATGFDSFNPAHLKQYGYGVYPNVVTAEDFEALNNAAGPTGGRILLENGEEPRSIAILHCVGSRDKDNHPYCSRVCCMYAFKFAHLVKEKTNADVYQLYIDVRAYGKGYEEFYQRILDEGVNVIRGKGAEVVASGSTRRAEGPLLVRCEDTLIGKFREIPVDMVVLCTALESRHDAHEFGRKFNISTGADGWFIEAHPKLAPVSTTTEGVFIAGACQGAKDIPDSVAQGGAAASQAMKLMNKGELMMDAAYAEVREEFCSGCKFCNDLCPFSAIEYIEDKSISHINEALCKACGTCVAACPAGAIKARHFTDEQIYAQIEGILA